MEHKTLEKEFSSGKPLPILKVCIKAITILLTQKRRKMTLKKFQFRMWANKTWTKLVVAEGYNFL